MRVTLKEIAEKKGVSWHAIRKQKQKEGWQACGTRLVNHKAAEEFETDSLPDSTKALFLNPGNLPMVAGDKVLASAPELSTSLVVQGGVMADPDQLAPVRTSSAPEHTSSTKLLPENSTTLVKLGSGEMVNTDTGEIVAHGTVTRPLSDEEIESEIYAAAPEWAKRQADKYLQIVRTASGLKGATLRQFIAEWNGRNSDFKTSYDSVLEARKKYAEQGISGLLAKYGHSAGLTKVQDEHYKYFKGAFLKEGAPSTKSCWTRTLGYARTLDPQIKPETFPSPSAFQRRLEREIPESSIYLARYGHDAWNRKYASYLDRDYNQLKPGEVIVSDHAQVDVAVMLPNNRVCFPWITVWSCFKTSKYLGWIHHPEPPNSDFIFQSFYYAVKEYGLPTDVYIDNGRDYKSRDFAGGRKRHKIAVDEKKSTSMLALLNITPHFALPYNAQTKPIERSFLRNKEWFSMHMPGYRGGNVAERPEILEEEIKRGRILSLDEYVKLMDVYITTVANKMPSDGKVLQGRCADEAWDAERTEMRKVSVDALKLFCQRTSKEVTIGRNGIRDSELQVSYFGDFMYSLQGTKVYLRRDVRAYQTAWVFDASNDEFLGKAELVGAVPALARTDIERAQLKAALAQKNRHKKIAKSYFDMKDRPSAYDTVDHLAAGVAAVNQARGYETVGKKKIKIVRMANTAMDKVVRQDREMQKNGTYDDILIDLQPPEPLLKKPLHMLEYLEDDDDEDFKKEMDEYNAALEERQRRAIGNVIRAGILEMDLDRKRVKVGDVIVDLLPMEFRLLQMLMENRGKVFSRAEIKDTIWRGGVSAELRAIDVHIRRLRAALEKVGADRYILTKVGSGYFLSEDD